MTKLTPMMRQYKEIKDGHADCILFFRLGDFYEMFEEDAERAAKVLDIVLTKRHGTPMCGVPYHAVEQYLARLTAAGMKVAICEQVSDPSLPGIVKREVVRVVTPGTTFSDNLLDGKSNNYAVAIYPKRDYFGLAAIDLTTGEFLVTELHGYDQLATEIQRLQPREVILPTDLNDENLVTLLEAFESVHVYPYDTYKDAQDTLRQQFKVHSLEAFGIEKWPFAIQAAGQLLNYLKDTQKQDLSHLKSLRPYAPGDHMILDEATLRNLELLSNLREGQKKGSLLGVLDHTQTAMGGRLLKNWLIRPLTDLVRIEGRQEAVEILYKDESLHSDLTEEISEILDLERVLGRLCLDRGNPRDLVALKVSLMRIPAIKKMLKKSKSRVLTEIYNRLQLLPDLVSLLHKAIIEEPPINLKEGGYIHDSFNSDLYELRTLAREGKGFIKNLQEREI